jgi:hypothetical protein
MPAFAPAALGVAVAVSAVGAVALCILVVLYGFTPTGDEASDETAARRLLVTRVGHALGAVCFTATTILIAVVLARAQMSPPSMPAPDPRVPRLNAQITEQADRLSRTETRLQRLENAAARRVAEPPASASPPTGQAAEERSASPPRHRPAVAKREPGRPEISTSAESSAALPRPPRPAGGPVASLPTAASPAVAPATAPPVPAAPPPIAPASRSTAVDAQATAPTPPPARGVDLRSKLREDWREIRRGVESAPDDFRRAIDDVKRALAF